ncbi:metalloendopeptidase [Rhizophagus clarus]|uniref:Metalloendopeptidase n=1 Tax=Rhizophagus clarus TaxID=94130 RepID=A0A8H3LCH0_9GLOM|nr:metalloendopeptidase [Rhizophagus clarus]
MYRFLKARPNVKFRHTFDKSESCRSSISFPLSTSQKLVPKSLIYQCRPFHATQPTLVTSFVTFKTVNAVLVIRKLSNLLFSFLPFALRKHPKTGRRRRLLIFITTVMPLTGFCILILAGLDRAPHTGRLRFKFMSEEEERELCNLAFSRETEKYGNNFLSIDRLESEFVCHVACNLVKGLNNDLMTLKSFKNLSDKESNEKVANIIEENVDNMSDKNMNIQQGEKIPKPFEIYVIEDDGMLNALSFGASKKIIIFTGWLKLINYNEEYLAFTLSHEIAHIIQGHSSEPFGFSQILYMFADTARTLLWFPFLSAFGPLINDYLNSATQNLIEKYTFGRYNQRAEKEADIVGLQLMALSGYHPKKAVELWKYISSLNKTETNLQDNVIEEGIVKTDEIEEDYPIPLVQSLQDFFASHPLDEVRADYLFDMLPEAEKIYEEVIDKDGRAISFIFDNHIKKPIKAIKNTEGQIMTRIWNSFRYLIGLNPGHDHCFTRTQTFSFVNHFSK